MGFFKKLIDTLTLGSDKPLGRLCAYYLFLGAVTFLLIRFVPHASQLILGEHAPVLTTDASMLLDGLTSAKDAVVEGPPVQTGLELALTTFLILLSTLALMLPVSWVFMSTRGARDYDHSVVQTLIVLPLIVAGIVLVVRTSLALAFSLGGIVAGLRFRTTMQDVRDIVYIFLGIGVGLAAGVQSLIVAAVLSITFNFVVLLIWRYDFGRGNILEGSAGAVWEAPLADLAERDPAEGVADRDLVLAISPKRAAVLAERFARVQDLLGTSQKKPRFNAVLTVITDSVGEAQSRIELVLDTVARRWRLDQVVTNEGKPSELYYLVGVRKLVDHDRFMTAMQEGCGDTIISAELEISDASGREKQAAK